MANFSKTAKGHEEIEQRNHGLSPKLRRVLIVADGSKTLEDLAQFCRPGELDGILQGLVAGGFIAGESLASRLAPQPNAEAPSAAPAGAPDMATVKQVQQDASRFLYDKMGPASESICLEIERCKTALELRATFRKVEGILAGMSGERAAQDFARRFGQRLM
jgi:hypothetical protein